MSLITLRRPSPWRALNLIAVTTVVTLLVFYNVLMETDYGKALFFTYDELWDIAEQKEASGHTAAAEKLIRHIVTMEENRATLKFGLFVLWADSSYLVRAQLKLAELYARHGRSAEADATYREAIAAVGSLDGFDSWRAPVSEFRYAQFLVARGRIDDARACLVRADEHAQQILAKREDSLGAIWNEEEETHRPMVRALTKDIADLREAIVQKK